MSNIEKGLNRITIVLTIIMVIWVIVGWKVAIDDGVFRRATGDFMMGYVFGSLLAVAAPYIVFLTGSWIVKGFRRE